MYNLKEGFDKYMSSNDIVAQAPEKAKTILKHAWMDGAACVLREFAKMYRQNPKAAIALMQHLGQDAHAYEQYADDMMKQVQAKDDEDMPETAQKRFGWGGRGFGWGGRSWGGFGGWPLGWGVSSYWPGSYGWGGGYPGYGMYWKDGMHHADQRMEDDRSMPYDGPDGRYMPGHMEGHMAGHMADRYDDGRIYDKMHPYYRGYRERYPDVEADKMPQDGRPYSHDDRPRDPNKR